MAARWIAIAGAVLAVWVALDVLLLLFAGILLAIVLRTGACWLASLLRVRTGIGLFLVLVVIVGTAVSVGRLYAPTLAEQTDQLATRIPEALGDLSTRVREFGWGRWLLGELEQDGPDPVGERVVERAAGAAGQIVRVVVSIAVILFSGLYFAAEPYPYLRGAIRLFPMHRRRRIAEVIYACGYVLRYWLLGQGFSMVVVGVTMGLGLTLIGVPLAFILGVLAGLFEFIPIVGPMLAVTPALMLALAESTQKALYVLILYTIIQTIEPYVLTPLVQRKAVRLPPVVTITAQLSLTWLAGPIGLLVAVPLVATVLVSVQLLYVTDLLKDRIEPGVEKEASREVDAAARKPLRRVLPEERSEA